MAHPGGRPTDYTPEKAREICAIVADNPMGLRRLCAAFPELPAANTIKLWRRTHPEFMAQYLLAKEEQALSYAEELADCVDEIDERQEAIAKATLRWRVHQWHLSKLAPKLFGDKKHIEQNVTHNVHEDTLEHLK